MLKGKGVKGREERSDERHSHYWSSSLVYVRRLFLFLHSLFLACAIVENNNQYWYDDNSFFDRKTRVFRRVIHSFRSSFFGKGFGKDKQTFADARLYRINHSRDTGKVNARCRKIAQRRILVIVLPYE